MLIHLECVLQRREHDRVKASVMLHYWGAQTPRRLCIAFRITARPLSPGPPPLQPPS